MKFLRRYTTSSKNLYKILGISENSTNPEIKKAYFELVKKYHPDTCKEPDAKEKFLEIQQAYEILSDPEKKSTYDNYGTTSESSFNPDFGANPFGNDIFSSIFSNFGAGRNPFSGFGRSEIDADIETHLNLTFMEAALGCKKTIRYKRDIDCGSCNGTGSAKGTSPTICSNCRGSGQDAKVRNGFIFSKTCSHCSGAGTINLNPCTTCHGSKTSKTTENLELNVPAGVTEEYALQFKGKGNKLGRTAGDLIIRLTIGKSHIFERKGRDIYSTTSLDLYTALAGGEVQVPTIHGDVLMKILPGTQPGELKKLSNKGIIDLSKGSGNHYVKINVEIPRNIPSDKLNELKSILKTDTSKTKGKWFRKRSRKSLPSRSVSPTCFNPGVFLRIGTSQCSVIRDDLNLPEILPFKHKMRDYGFQVSVEEQQPLSAPNTPSQDFSITNSFSSSSQPEPSSLSSHQESKKITRKQLPPGERCCASCGATKTPYWRDAWGENISLCNACGLRYAKFKKRCSTCHYVPRKEDKNGRCCSQCRGNWL